MIQTIAEYKEGNGLTWAALAAEFGASRYQEAQNWAKSGWLVITERCGTVTLVSPRRIRVENN